MHSTILSTCTKLHVHVPPAVNSFVLSIFDWPLKTGFTVSVVLKVDNGTCIKL